MSHSAKHFAAMKRLYAKMVEGLTFVFSLVLGLLIFVPPISLVGSLMITALRYLESGNWIYYDNRVILLNFPSLFDWKHRRLEIALYPY